MVKMYCPKHEEIEPRMTSNYNGEKKVASCPKCGRWLVKPVSVSVRRTAMTGLLQSYEDYITFLEQEIGRIAIYQHVHSQSTPTYIINEGVKRRETLLAAKAECPAVIFENVDISQR